MRLSISNPYQNLLISHIILFVLCFIQAIVRALQLEIDVVDKNVLNKNEILSRKYIKEMHKELSNPTIIFINKKKTESSSAICALKMLTHSNIGYSILLFDDLTVS